MMKFKKIEKENCSIFLFDGVSFAVCSPALEKRVFQKKNFLQNIQFYTIQRILKALSLLLEHKFTVNEVARKVGYSSVPTFSNTFYKIIGQRPSEYISGVEILKKPADYSASLFKV
ncbi:helix-turn-helix domain-containing protein [Flavobacterium kingsejongi]|uniref:HTH araC/xylS-type domain-containing protein n=1 Tax=Flavobacterium kingsejongi TaxID=1678728 RepID=A0A2S1LRL5_9FLAO|nr:helix-turn-helix domain-containing protein [Flavobacterium kingsejongi]AWG26407.1 hypothetical protein FK004_14815 [Flavobacterium kingsejongi]